MQTVPRTRRSHEQALAHKKYGRMKYVRGDGEYLVPSKCSAKWTYILVADSFEALLAANKSCGADCLGCPNCPFPPVTLPNKNYHFSRSTLELCRIELFIAKVITHCPRRKNLVQRKQTGGALTAKPRICDLQVYQLGQPFPRDCSTVSITALILRRRGTKLPFGKRYFSIIVCGSAKIHTRFQNRPKSVRVDSIYINPAVSYRLAVCSVDESHCNGGTLLRRRSVSGEKSVDADHDENREQS